MLNELKCVSRLILTVNCVLDRNAIMNLIKGWNCFIKQMLWLHYAALRYGGMCT